MRRCLSLLTLNRHDRCRTSGAPKPPASYGLQLTLRSTRSKRPEAAESGGRIPV